jgi:hypothetical protein
MRAAKNIESAITTTLPAALARNAYFAQAAAKRYPRLRIGRQKDDNAFAFLVIHNRLGTAQKRFGFNDGLKASHARKLYANGVYVNGVFARRIRSAKSEQIAAFVRRLYCKTCKAASGEKRHKLKVEQTSEPQGAPLMPGPDEVEWKRFVRGQRR